MLNQISVIAAMLTTSGLLQIGHGSLAALLIQQGQRLEFSATTLGFLTSATYVGFIAGIFLQRRLLPRISFIRTFAVCAAALSVLAIIMAILPNEWVWLVVRFMHGLFFSVALVVCEGWINARANNENRNRLMGLFIAVNYMGYGISQYILLLGVGWPDKAFLAATAFLIISMVPVCLTRFAEPQAPPRDEGGSMSFMDAYRVAPVSFLGQVGFGFATGAGWLFVAYLSGLEVSAEEGATLAVIFYGAGFILQVPMGWLADHLPDRRDLLGLLAGISALLAAVLFFGPQLSSGILMFLIFAYGSVSSPLFSLNIAYGQSFVAREKSADYSFRLFQGYAWGALIGPPLAGFLMGAFSPSMLFALIAVTFAAIAGITATNRLMPKYRPVKTEHVPVVSPLLASQAITEDIMYNEFDIGPDLPAEEAVEITDSPAEIGPNLPEQEGPPTAEAAGEFVGPLSPEGDLAAEGKV